METVDVLMKMPKVEGYEYTGEYRVPRMGESCWSPVTESIQECEGHGTLARAILRKAEVWKPLTLEKVLEMGKSRDQYKFRACIGREMGVKPGLSFNDSVKLIDLDPATRSNVRLGYFGWINVADLEYLET